MIICIECKAEIKRKMDSLLGDDRYKDYSELVAVAVENLWMLEREVAKNGALVIGEGSAPPCTPADSLPGETTKMGGSRKTGSTPSRQNKGASLSCLPFASASVHIPELFLSDGIERLPTVTVKTPSGENAGETFTLDRWLFGQYNKLLPIKANCRALIRLTAGTENGAPLETTATRIAEAAALLGDYLVEHDRQYQLGRDNALATAFPRSGPGTQKSCARYANQFVGSVNSQNALSGLLWDYRLVGLTSGDGPLLLPTEQAIHLARMTSPILDGCQTEPVQKFSEQETDFLLEHIRSYVPVETFAFLTLIQAIASGANTPNKLEEALRPLIPAGSNRSLSKSFLASQRSGALSRMADLGMIIRLRKGVKVTYRVTERAQNFRQTN